MTVTNTAWPGAAGVLAPGQTVTVTATYTTTQADVDGGSITNTANATGTPPTGAPVAAAAAVTVSFVQHPTLTFVKTGSVPDQADVEIGDTVTFHFAVTNTGNTTEKNVTITDPMTGLSAVGSFVWPGAAGTLLPGQTMTATATYQATAADIDNGSVRNTATVTATAPGGNPTAIGDVTVPLVADPVIHLEKSGTLASGGTPKAGDVVDYTFTVSNGASLTLTGVKIVDGMSGLSAISFGTWPGASGQLAAGESVTATASYTLTQADIDRGTVLNSATASATGGGKPATGGASATVDLTPAPSVTLTKTTAFSSSRPTAGTTVPFTFTVTNTGNVTLNGLAVADHLAGAGAGAVTFGSWPTTTGTLAPGETVAATADYALSQADIDAGSILNTATVSGTGARGGSVTADASKGVPLTAAPAISFAKTAVRGGGATPQAGDVVTYTLTAGNTGNVTITGVTFSDTMAGLSAITPTWPGTVGTLAPGETATATATYTLTQADLDNGSVVNAASVSGSPVRGTTVDGDDSVTVPLAAEGAVTLKKTGEITQLVGKLPVPGDIITYSFEVKNTGNVTATAVQIADPLAGLSAVTVVGWPGLPGVLAPGQSVTGTATYAVTQADIDTGKVDNTATVTAQPVRGSALSVDSSATVTLPGEDGLVLVKRAQLVDPNKDGVAQPGETIKYTFTITNTGTRTIAKVDVADKMVAITDGGVSLAPGETVTLHAVDYRTTVADGARGKIVNTASATGVNSAGDPVTSSDSTATVKADPPASKADPSSGLASTGSSVPVVPIVIGASLLVLGLLSALVAFLLRRRRAIR